MERIVVTVRFRETKVNIYMVRLPCINEQMLWNLTAKHDLAPGQMYRVSNVTHFADPHYPPEIELEEVPG